MGLQLTQVERYLLFPLVGWSLSAGDLESFYLIVVLLLDGTEVQTWFHHCLARLVRACLIGHHHCPPRGLPESSSFSQCEGDCGIDMAANESWEWKGVGVLGWNFLSDPGLWVFSSPKLGSLDRGASNRIASSGCHSLMSKYSFVSALGAY